MARTDFKSVDDYIASQPVAAQPVLKRVRGVIRAALPDAEEVISYQIPAYRLDGGIVLFFAGWKKHYSLYPANGELISAFSKELAPYEVNDKGTIRFPLDEPVPEALIGGIARFRARQQAAAQAGKKTGKQ